MEADQKFQFYVSKYFRLPQQHDVPKHVWRLLKSPSKVIYGGGGIVIEHTVYNYTNIICWKFLINDLNKVAYLRLITRTEGYPSGSRILKINETNDRNKLQ